MQSGLSRKLGVTAVLAALSLLLLNGCAQQNGYIVPEYKSQLSDDKRALREGFIGRWRSEQPNDNGGTNITTVHRSQDGRYLMEYTILDSQSNVKNHQEEFGFWGVAGGVYFTLFKGWVENDEFYPADPTNAYHYDAYQILAVEPEAIAYENLASGNKFYYSKVEVK